MGILGLLLVVVMLVLANKSGGGSSPTKDTRTCHWCGKEYVKPNSGRLFYCSNQCEELSKHFKK